MYGAGFVTLEYLTERMADDKLAAWTAYVLEWDRLAAARAAAEEHAKTMKAAARAAARGR